MPGRKSIHAGKVMLCLWSATVFLFGLALLLYPSMNGLWVDYMLHRDAEAFLSFVHTDAYHPKEHGSQTVVLPAGTGEQAETLPEQYPELWQAMRDYNKAICLEGQAGLSDPSAYETPSFTLADYGLDSEVFAVLTIPKLEMEMPIYLGATKQHMADGAAQMSQTSLPIGGPSTNCVIAGHRGWNGAAYFLHLPNLKAGDLVTVTNLWEELSYRVVATKVIRPNDVEAIHIQPNRDMITLLTCHPPATGGRERYLVYCERVETE